MKLGRWVIEPNRRSDSELLNALEMSANKGIHPEAREVIQALLSHIAWAEKEIQDRLRELKQIMPLQTSLGDR